MRSNLSLGASTPPIHGVRRHRHGGLASVLAIGLTLGLASLAAAQVPASVLTLGAALDAAQAQSATLQAQDRASEAMRDLAVAAGRLPDPVMRLSVDSLPIEGPSRYSLTADFMTTRSVSLLQTFTSSDKRQARSARFEREAEAASSLRAMQKARLLTQTAQAWLDRHFQEQIRDLMQQQRGDAVRVSEAAESAYRGGRTSQAEVLASHAAIARIDDRLHEVHAELTSVTARLQRWVGSVGSQPLGSLPRIAASRMAEHPDSHNMDQYPDIAVLNAREQVALAEVGVARQEKNADWSWSFMYSQRGSRFGDMVSLGVSIPLQWDQPNKQDRELAARLQRVEQVRLEREEMWKEQRFEVQRLLTNWRSNLTRMDDYDKTLIPLATERVHATQAAFRGGKAPLVAVLEAQRMVTDTRLERLRIEKQAALWWATLEFRTPEDTDPQGPVGSQPNPAAQEPKP